MIGDLRHRLSLQSRSRVPDGAGGFTETWADVAAHPVVYAAIRAVGGTEALRAGQLQGTTTYRLLLRYREDINADMRLSDGAGHYDIIAVLDRDGRKQYLEVTATRQG